MRSVLSSLEAFLRQELPQIDERLEADGRPVHDRPLMAAQIIVELYIVDIQGDTKEDYLLKDWFAEIYQSISGWYGKRYGSAKTQRHPSQIRGVVDHFGTPYILRVPLVLSEPGEGSTSWLRFPKEVLPHEKPTAWIDDAPPLKELAPRRLQRLEETAERTATLLRGINNNLISADLGNGKTRATANGVLRHLEKAAVDIATQEGTSSSLAMWELQMACEKTMKAYLAQRSITYPVTHDLRLLHRLSPDAARQPELKKAVSAMPLEHRIIAWRHAELDPPTTVEVLRVYRTALEVCDLWAARMLRKYVFKNFAVQIRVPSPRSVA